MDWKDIELTDKQRKELKQTGKFTVTDDQMKQLGFEKYDLDKQLKFRKELWEHYTKEKELWEHYTKEKEF